MTAPDDLPFLEGERWAAVGRMVAALEQLCDGSGLYVVQQWEMPNDLARLIVTITATPHDNRVGPPNPARPHWIGDLEDPPGVPLEIRDGLL
jgi:hypothetical protein